MDLVLKLDIFIYYIIYHFVVKGFLLVLFIDNIKDLLLPVLTIIQYIMRFRFLGDVDCPDWILAEIFNLSQMSTTCIKTVGIIVIQSIINEKFDENIEKKSSLAAKIESVEIAAIIGVLEMIFTSSARNCVLPADLRCELQQLGLPREHGTVISILHMENNAQITKVLMGLSLKINNLSSILVQHFQNFSPHKILSLKLKTLEDEDKKKLINITQDKVNKLLLELKALRSFVELVLQ